MNVFRNTLETDKKMQALLVVPVFLLILGCVLSMSKLLGAAVIIRFLLCRYYKIKGDKEIFCSSLFKKSVVFMFLYLLLLFIPTVIMQGDISEIGHYAERMLPFFLLFFVQDRRTDIWSVLWLAVMIGVSVICLDTLSNIGAVKGRLAGNFSSANSLGGILALCMPICYFGLYKFFSNKKVVVLDTVLLLTSFVLMLLTQSRGSVLAWSASVVVFLAAICVKHRWRPQKIFIFVMVGILLVAAFFGASREVGLNFDRTITKDGRIPLLIAGGKMFVDHPLLGVGGENWQYEYDHVYGVGNRENHMDSPHNIFLQVLNEAGIIGLSGFLALLCFQVRCLLKTLSKDLLSQDVKLQWPVAILLTYTVALIHGQVDYIFFQRGYQMFYWLLWGVYCWACVYKKYDTKNLRIMKDACANKNK